ncbi:MAG TPA: hypothetical protein VMS17_08175 [Gemmataceae bacterium]|nr:hypothetical protein [Gemmataceae bacterium]
MEKAGGLSPSARGRFHWTAAVAAILVVGACLRLVWGGDIEYKDDEAKFFAESQRVQRLTDLSWSGQTASVGLPAAGMSVWVLVGLGKLFAATDPVSLARAVQICNIVALASLIGLIGLLVPPKERETWLWAAALAAVNPITVLLHRKIWNPSVLPLLTVVLLAGWLRRDRRLGAFVWGLIGPCMGQIHAAGFFFAAGFALWAALFDRRRVAWRAWLIGSCLGALPILPWLWQLASAPPTHAPYHGDSWVHLLEFKFWVRWISQALGFGVDYNIGSEQFGDLLRGPYVLGRPTYLVGALHAVVLAVAVGFLARGAVLLWRQRDLWRGRWTGGAGPSDFTLNAAWWGFGLLQTLCCFPTHRHYLIILFPLQFLWLTRLALRRRNPEAAPRPAGRAALAVLWGAQLLITVSLLQYIHAHPRTGGEYGPTYASQQAAWRR